MIQGERFTRRSAGPGQQRPGEQEGKRAGANLCSPVENGAPLLEVPEAAHTGDAR
jgi:hypothetical protein